AIGEAGRFDGLYAIATNLCDPPHRSLTAQDVLVLYKDQWLVEQRHRASRSLVRRKPASGRGWSTRLQPLSLGDRSGLIEL
ncbi:MAG TPA: hypothetical protein VMT85_04545, partial [Thermoanaerobaculia bacterium]|nr:hypothetical protein [Thermoanaerobaculia bacterium]